MQIDPIEQRTVHGFLEAVASNEPVPGGGAVAAVAGAAAAALLRMVTSLAARRAKDPVAHSALGALVEQARILQQRFAELADADVSAYEEVAKVLALPRSTDDERAARSTKLQIALQRAAKVPLETARGATDALRLAAQTAPLCPRVAQSDLVTAIHLLHAGCASALANVDANALSLAPSPLRDALSRSRTQIMSEVSSLQNQLLGPLDASLGQWRERAD